MRQKGRIKVPDEIEKKHASIVTRINELNLDGQLIDVNMDQFNDAEDDTCVCGSGYTVGWFPKSWLDIERNVK